MKKLIGFILAIMLVGGIFNIALNSPAQAAGCAPVEHLTRDVSVNSDNLLVAGRPIRFTLHVDKQDCDGYDLISGMWGTITKNNGNCTNAFGITDDYRLNPNVIGNYNGGTQFLNCNGGQVNYATFWNPYEKLTASMPENDRCVSMHVVVDLSMQGDPNLDTPTLCFNGA
jgi:hypothetical protein